MCSKYTLSCAGQRYEAVFISLTTTAHWWPLPASLLSEDTSRQYLVATSFSQHLDKDSINATGTDAQNSWHCQQRYNHPTTGNSQILQNGEPVLSIACCISSSIATSSNFFVRKLLWVGWVIQARVFYQRPIPVENVHKPNCPLHFGVITARFYLIRHSSKGSQLNFWMLRKLFIIDLCRK